MEVTNRELLDYCKVFYDYFLPVYLAADRYVRIDLYTKESGHVVVSIQPHKDKSAQGISIHEGADDIDEPIEQANKTADSYYIVKDNHPENWTHAEALTDLQNAVDIMRTFEGGLGLTFPEVNVEEELSR